MVLLPEQQAVSTGSAAGRQRPLSLRPPGLPKRPLPAIGRGARPCALQNIQDAPMNRPIPDVYFHPVPDHPDPEILALAAGKAFDACGGPERIAAQDFVAVKTHVGEEGNNTFVPPAVCRVLGERIKAQGGLPFLTETSTLYRGQRENAIVHALQAHCHGFGIEATGMPFLPADGLAGNTEAEVRIPGELNASVKIAREILLADALVAVAHMTGHMCCGFGAMIKTLGMGLASRAGKLRQHSSIHPQIDADACTLCRKCMSWCPEQAIVEKAGKAFILKEKCIGCGECAAVCRFEAVEYDYSAQSGVLERQMAEHALGAVQAKRNKSVFINVAVNMTKDCDCLHAAQSRLLPDVGVFAALDPVAVDQACLDMIRKIQGRNLPDLAYPQLDSSIQLEHGEKIGLGSRKYRLCNCD